MHQILKTSSYIGRTHLLILSSLNNYWGWVPLTPPLATALVYFITKYCFCWQVVGLLYSYVRVYNQRALKGGFWFRFIDSIDLHPSSLPVICNAI